MDWSVTNELERVWKVTDVVECNVGTELLLYTEGMEKHAKSDNQRG